MRYEMRNDDATQPSNLPTERSSTNANVEPRLQRSSGATRLSFKPAPAGTALEDLYQEGCCKVRFPRGQGDHLEAVLLNTAGGLTDGDRLTTDINWRSGARATVTTQAAERIYRAATEDVAAITTRISIGDGCDACWLPQETILFDGARLARKLDIDMRSSSRLVALESIVFGRSAMGETVDHGRISDRWRLRIDDRLAFADHFLLDDHLTGRVAGYLDHAAVTNAAHCMATMVVAAASCEEIVAKAVRLVTPATTVIGATCLQQLAIIRILANDSQAMRIAVSRVIALVPSTFGIELPRVWHC